MVWSHLLLGIGLGDSGTASNVPVSAFFLRRFSLLIRLLAPAVEQEAE